MSVNYLDNDLLNSATELLNPSDGGGTTPASSVSVRDTSNVHVYAVRDIVDSHDDDNHSGSESDQLAVPDIATLNDDSDGDSNTDFDMVDQLDESTEQTDSILSEISTELVDFTLAPVVNVTDEHWPTGFKDTYDALDKRVSNEPIWKHLLAHWSELEKFYEFDSQVSRIDRQFNRCLPSRFQKNGFPARYRHPAIFYWMKRYRKMNPPPDICHPLSSFITSFWAWWVDINPKWREMDDRRRLVLGYTDQWQPNVKIKKRWVCVKCPGVNGLLGVIMALCWWRELMGPNDDTTDWQYAVRDVLWVVLQLRGFDLSRYRYARYCVVHFTDCGSQEISDT